MTLISIIIPYYKKRYYIRQTLQSILKQNYKNFEILLIYDDEDQTDLVLLKKLSKNDKRIKLIVNKKNIGAGMSRNKAIKLSKGNYIAFIDADDIWHRNKLQQQISFMKKNQINLCHTSYYIVNRNNKKIGLREAKELKFKSLLKSCDIGLSTVMVKKKLLKNNFFPNLKTKEDYVLWLKLTKKKNTFYFIKKPLTSWRSLDNSLSSSIIQKLIDGYNVYRIYMKQSFVQSIKSLFILSINFLKK
jgi:teichuronic acid biosynthesis glycosyltransferase TuaG